MSSYFAVVPQYNNYIGIVDGEGNPICRLNHDMFRDLASLETEDIESHIFKLPNGNIVLVEEYEPHRVFTFSPTGNKIDEFIGSSIQRDFSSYNNSVEVSITNYEIIISTSLYQLNDSIINYLNNNISTYSDGGSFDTFYLSNVLIRIDLVGKTVSFMPNTEISFSSIPVGITYYESLDGDETVGCSVQYVNGSCILESPSTNSVSLTFNTNNTIQISAVLQPNPVPVTLPSSTMHEVKDVSELVNLYYQIRSTYGTNLLREFGVFWAFNQTTEQSTIHVFKKYPYRRVKEHTLSGKILEICPLRNYRHETIIYNNMLLFGVEIGFTPDYYTSEVRLLGFNISTKVVTNIHTFSTVQYSWVAISHPTISHVYISFNNTVSLVGDDLRLINASQKIKPGSYGLPIDMGLDQSASCVISFNLVSKTFHSFMDKIASEFYFNKRTFQNIGEGLQEGIIEGVVKNSSNVVQPNIRVCLFNKNGSLINFTNTDNAGVYRFKCLGTEDLTVLVTDTADPTLTAVHKVTPTTTGVPVLTETNNIQPYYNVSEISALPPQQYPTILHNRSTNTFPLNPTYTSPGVYGSVANTLMNGAISNILNSLQNKNVVGESNNSKVKLLSYVYYNGYTCPTVRASSSGLELYGYLKDSHLSDAFGGSSNAFYNHLVQGGYYGLRCATVLSNDGTRMLLLNTADSNNTYPYYVQKPNTDYIYYSQRILGSSYSEGSNGGSGWANFKQLKVSVEHDHAINEPTRPVVNYSNTYYYGPGYDAVSYTDDLGLVEVVRNFIYSKTGGLTLNLVKEQYSFNTTTKEWDWVSNQHSSILITPNHTSDTTRHYCRVAYFPLKKDYGKYLVTYMEYWETIENSVTTGHSEYRYAYGVFGETAQAGTIVLSGHPWLTSIDSSSIDISSWSIYEEFVSTRYTSKFFNIKGYNAPVAAFYEGQDIYGYSVISPIHNDMNYYRYTVGTPNIRNYLSETSYLYLISDTQYYNGNNGNREFKIINEFGTVLCSIYPSMDYAILVGKEPPGSQQSINSLDTNYLYNEINKLTSSGFSNPEKLKVVSGEAAKTNYWFSDNYTKLFIEIRTAYYGIYLGAATTESPNSLVLEYNRSGNNFSLVGYIPSSSVGNPIAAEVEWFGMVNIHHDDDGIGFLGYTNNTYYTGGVWTYRAKN